MDACVSPLASNKTRYYDVWMSRKATQNIHPFQWIDLQQQHCIMAAMQAFPIETRGFIIAEFIYIFNTCTC